MVIKILASNQVQKILSRVFQTKHSLSNLDQLIGAFDGAGQVVFIYKNRFSRLAFRECPYARLERPIPDRFSCVRDDNEEDLKT